MKHIVLFGAGKSATVLINFLKELATKRNWQVSIIDGDLSALESKIGHHLLVKPIALDIFNVEEKNRIIKEADIIISLMPPHLHMLIAEACLQFNKNLLTASYIDEVTKKLSQQVKEKNLLFLYEMGLDPGIDHMSAMQIIDEIKSKGGKITSFKSHCGGLVTPESINNPWFYKLTWNPRNIVLAGKSGAVYVENGNEMHLLYENLFNEENRIQLPNGEVYGYYANRDSLSYTSIYGLEMIPNFIRTTLRFPAFIKGWKNIVALKLTDEEKVYDTNNVTLAEFFKLHFQKHHLKVENDLQLEFFGLNDNKTIINKGLCSTVDVLQYVMELKLSLQPNDKDMIIMFHEFEYELNGQLYQLKSYLKVVGENDTITAMAKTVGLPLGIAAELILDGVINTKGLMIPTVPEIYHHVLKELEKHDIIFEEFTT
jgi:saccharopine dehydrogenase-like NADP-dependent oxidoreductase